LKLANSQFLPFYISEEKNDSISIADLASRKADGPIFIKLGLSNGKD